jgi:hypothetical protein
MHMLVIERIDRGYRGPSAVWCTGWPTAACVAAVLVLLQTSCVVLPVRVAPGVSGRIVDQVSGDPVEGALVVVRFDGHYDDVLPDREMLGHRESTTDANGNFSVGALIQPGLSAWPSFRTEARVVAVMRDGYRCPRLRPGPIPGDIRIGIQPALDAADRRESCRPVAAEKGEATVYMAAWRALYPDQDEAPDREEALQMDRLLSARSAFGFGENCEGPALDISLAPDGRRAAFSVAVDGESEVHIVDLRVGRAMPVQVVARETGSRPRRLVWTSPGDLVLWEPTLDAYPPGSTSAFSTGRFERVWSASGPASRAPAEAGAQPPQSAETAHPTLVPENLSDESDSRWLGRSFVLHRSPNADTGLARDELRVYREDATNYTVALPGEPCGPPGRFGRPQYRIAADSRTSLDLRFVEGGCHVIRTDLESGEWSAVDGTDRPGTCRSARRIQASEFKTAFRGYSSELEATIFDAGADSAAAYALRIEPGGKVQLDTRGFSGEPVTLEVPAFPIDTPLRRIEVSVLGGTPSIRESSATPRVEPL